MKFQGKTVLITGGASGIGKIMSRLALERGARVVIWDIDPDNLNGAIKELLPYGDVSGKKVDISNPEQIIQAADSLKNVDILINNAGIVTGKYFHEQNLEEIKKTLDVNTLAHLNITRLFLDKMLENKEGHICNITSSAGLLGNPKMSVYVASKWAMTGWSESLRLEMKKLNKNISVTTVLPYYIDTGMFAGVRSKIPIQNPEKTAEKIIKAIEKDKKLITIPGWIYRVSRLGQALFPVNFFDWFTGKLLGVYTTMDHFKGKNK